MVGEIGRPHGVRGLVRLRAFTEDPAAIAAYSPLTDESGARRFVLTLKGGDLAAIEGVADRDAAQRLTGTKLYVERDRLPATAEEEFYLTDLIGLEGRDPADVVLGKVKSVQNFGADDMLEIAPAEGGPTWYLPFTRDAVPDIRLAEGWLRVLRPVEVGEREPD